MQYTEQQAIEALRQHPHLCQQLMIKGNTLKVYNSLPLGEPISAGHLKDRLSVLLHLSEVNRCLRNLVTKGYVEMTHVKVGNHTRYGYVRRS